MTLSEHETDIAVIGSGPAGLSAALATAEKGIAPLIFEKLRTPSLKLLASGGGKCNISNILSIEEFMKAFGREGKFMKNALETAYHDWLFDFLRSASVPLKLVNDFHWFPASERSRDVQEAFSGQIRRLGGSIRTDTQIAELLDENGRISGVRTADGIIWKCRAVILAGGGTAAPELGGGTAALKLAEALGHTISPLHPAMAPLLIRDRDFRELSGISLPDAELAFRRGRRTFRNRGELLFTHDGVSGPCALDLAGDLSEVCAAQGDTELLLKPAAGKEPDFWRQEIERMRRDDGRKQISTQLSRSFPHALANLLCIHADCRETRVCELPADRREKLCSLLGTGIPLTAYGAGPMNRAMAMKGGIKLGEIDPRTMESRLVPGLYFAGEIMDLTGPCGGYNIQWALSSGRFAGMNAADALLRAE